MKPLDVILIIMVAISAGVAIYFIARGLKRGGGCGSCGGCNGCKSRGYCNAVNRGEKNRIKTAGKVRRACLGEFSRKTAIKRLTKGRNL